MLYIKSMIPFVLVFIISLLKVGICITMATQKFFQRNMKRLLKQHSLWHILIPVKSSPAHLTPFLPILPCFISWEKC